MPIQKTLPQLPNPWGGDLVEVEPLFSGSRDLHDINPRPSMVLKLRRADLLIRLGLEQDSWVDSLIEVAKNKKVFPGKLGYLDCSTGIDPLEVPQGQLDGRHGDVHKLGNPHYWLNPYNGILIAKQIRDKLVMIRPEGKDVFYNNFNSFSSLLNKKILVWEKTLAPLKKSRFVTYHKTWAYFFDAFELNSIGQLEPLPGIPPTTGHLNNLKVLAFSDPSPIVVVSAKYYPKHSGIVFADSVRGRFLALSTSVGDNGIKSYTDIFDSIVKELTRK
ncbi:hypothetical protein DID77_01845 [Candidatus Marinamargulisbacteria bacterium SCGC AG-439-L15]|nr:hypothetical protein DID77_01845 [Candidatus Marinamargulisbacteria bacterium SCGC AG-439-L15]